MYPASLFPSNPVPGTLLPRATAATASATTNGGAVELTGLSSGVNYWLAVSDQNAGVLRWFPIPTSSLGNTSTTQMVVAVPSPTPISVSDAILERATGSWSAWSNDA